MTIKEHTDNFISLLDKEHRPSVESRWPVPLILHHMQNVRSQLLNKKYNQENKPIDQEDMHMIPCVVLENGSEIDCKKMEELGCMFVRKIKNPLPNLITTKDLLIRSIDGSFEYDYVRWEDYRVVLNSKHKGEREMPYYSIKRESDGIYIYILNDKVKQITIEGIFNSVIDPYLYPTCEDIDFSCIDFRKFEIPISSYLINEMYNITYQLLLTVDRSSDYERKDDEQIDVNKR